MATFEAQVEGLTQIAISGTSAPTQTELSQFLTDGATDVINKVLIVKPQESSKFAAESTISNSNGVTVNGIVLNVVRRNGNTEDIRPATPIDPKHRYLATQKSSLYFRSSLNPGFYVLNKKVYVVPAPESASTEAYVSQISYPTVAFGNSIGDIAFPAEYESLLVYYAAAMSCMAAATDIHNNMPTKVVKLNNPSFSVEDVSLPSLPEYISVPLEFDMTKVNSRLAQEDMEMAEKEMEKLSKNIDKAKALSEQNVAIYNKELEIFKSTLETSVNNADRRTQQLATEYRSALYKHQQEVAQYQAELQESMTKYKWYIEQYVALMNQYNSAFGSAAPQPREGEDGG
jgi:hypothetical protein